MLSPPLLGLKRILMSQFVISTAEHGEDGQMPEPILEAPDCRPRDVYTLKTIRRWENDLLTHAWRLKMRLSFAASRAANG